MIDPVAPAPIGNMGQPIPRYDARAKVTGKALYAADMALPDVAYAYLLSSRIAKGRIRSFDLKAARALPGEHLLRLPRSPWNRCNPAKSDSGLTDL